MIAYDKEGHVDIEFLMNSYIAFDEPIPFKGLLIYPISMKDYHIFHNCIQVFMIDKNQIGKGEFISVSYLEFLIRQITKESNLSKQKFSNIAYMLDTILKLSLHYDESISYSIDEKKRFYIHIGDTKISSKDFNELKRIILYQNVFGYDENDQFVNPALMEAFNEYNRIKSDGNVKVPLIEQISCIQSHTGLTKSEIKKMSILSFNMLFNSMMGEIDYIINKTAELSGAVKFKTPLEHWGFRKDKRDKFSEAFMSLDEYERKMSPVT